MKPKFIIPLLLFVMGSIWATEITVNDAVEIAKSNNLAIINADIDIANAVYKDKHDYHSLLPSVSLSSTIRRSNAGTEMSIPQLGIDMSSDPTFSLILGVNLSYNFNPAMITSLKVAPMNVRISELEKQQVIAQTEANVKKLFYAIIFQQQALEIQKENLTVLEERYEEAKEKFENGYAMDLDVLQAEVALENKRNEIKKSEREIENQLLSFKYMLSLPLDEEITLIGDLEYIIPDKKALTAGISNDELILLENMNLMKVQSTMLKQQIYIPSLSFSIGYQPVLADMAGSWAGENFKDNGAMSLTVAFDLTNLLPSSSARLSLKELEYTQQKLVNNQKMLSSSNELKLRQALENISSIEDAMENATRTIELASKSVDMTRDLYMNGYADAITLKDTENQLEFARLSLLSEEFNYINALIDLETITGQELI